MCLWISQAPQQVSCENLAGWYQSREHASSEQPAKCQVIPTSESPAVKTPNLLDPRMTPFRFSVQGGSYMMHLLAILYNFVTNRQLSSLVREIFLMWSFALVVVQEKTRNPRFDLQCTNQTIWPTLKMKILYSKFTRSQFKHVGISGKMTSKTLMCLPVNRFD